MYSIIRRRRYVVTYKVKVVDYVLKRKDIPLEKVEAMVKDGRQRNLCVYQRMVAKRRGGCMNACVQKGSWFPVCTQRLSYKDDLHVVTSVR